MQITRPSPDVRNEETTARTSFAPAVSLIVWVIAYWVATLIGIEWIRDRSHLARNNPIGINLYAIVCLAASIAAHALTIACLYPAISRTIRANERGRAFHVLEFGSLTGIGFGVALLWAFLWVSALLGMAPSFSDKLAMIQPHLVASVISTSVYFCLTRKRVRPLQPR